MRLLLQQLGAQLQCDVVLGQVDQSRNVGGQSAPSERVLYGTGLPSQVGRSERQSLERVPRGILMRCQRRFGPLRSLAHTTPLRGGVKCRVRRTACFYCRQRAC